MFPFTTQEEEKRIAQVIARKEEEKRKENERITSIKVIYTKIIWLITFLVSGGNLKGFSRDFF